MHQPLHVQLFAEPFFAREANGIHTALLQLRHRLPGRDNIHLVAPADATRPDVIHAHTVGPRYLLLSLQHRRRLVVTAHVLPDTCLGGVVFARLCQRLTTTYLRLAYNRARLVVAVSPPVQQALYQMGITSEVTLLCNGVDTAQFKPNPALRAAGRQQLKLPDDAFVVLSVGQIQPRKGVETMLAVAHQLPHFQFVWVGGRPFGRLTADYQALTQAIDNAPPNVTFVGAVPHEEMPAYYALADTLLFPSRQECFGYAVVEAAATGLPLLLHNIPAYRDYFYDHYLCAHDPAGYAIWLQRLHTDPAFYAQWQAQATTLAAQYDLDAFLNRLVTSYHQVAATARSEMVTTPAGAQ